MPRKLFTWWLIAFTFAWFGMLVPAHDRGRIQLPGLPAAGEHSCCATAAHKKSDPAPVKNTGNCAVCYFIATLDLPPAFELGIEPLALAAIENAPQPAAVVPAGPSLTYRSRGPPQA